MAEDDDAIEIVVVGENEYMVDKESFLVFTMGEEPEEVGTWDDEAQRIDFFASAELAEQEQGPPPPPDPPASPAPPPPPLAADVAGAVESHEDMEEKIEIFCSATEADEGAARTLLASVGWDLDEAINAFYADDEDEDDTLAPPPAPTPAPVPSQGVGGGAKAAAAPLVSAEEEAAAAAAWERQKAEAASQIVVWFTENLKLGHVHPPCTSPRLLSCASHASWAANRPPRFILVRRVNFGEDGLTWPTIDSISPGSLAAGHPELVPGLSLQV